MKNKLIHIILLSIPLSIVINLYFFPFSLEYYYITYGGILVSIPFFYWFYIKYYGKPDIKGVILIQLEILLHFLYTMGLLLYCNSIKNYIPVYAFLIFLICYYCFKLAILVALKK
ncbi:MAG: hypothetical protein KatS3mg129_2800 [Leptospiraceae bacterium]|nr:MAG: hypothetical protein KatS3mg129_2800 [Leptospiraceae bacterium]